MNFAGTELIPVFFSAEAKVYLVHQHAHLQQQMCAFSAGNLHFPAEKGAGAIVETVAIATNERLLPFFTELDSASHPTTNLSLMS